MTVLPEGRGHRRAARNVAFAQITLIIIAIYVGMSAVHSNIGHLLLSVGFGAVVVGLLLRDASRAFREISTDDAVVRAMQRAITRTRALKRQSGALMVEIDGFADLSAEYGAATQQQIQIVALIRLHAKLKSTDSLHWIGPGQFAVALSPSRHIDLESLLQVACNLQTALNAPQVIHGGTFYLSASVGCCMSERVPDATGALMFGATRMALREALRQGPGAVQTFTEAMTLRAAERTRLEHDISRALENGDIRAYFQPQVSLRTGHLTGFEALARWQHPSRGLIPPAEFLPIVEESGMIFRLGERILDDALKLIEEWQENGLQIDKVGVNFSSDELNDPDLVKRLQTQLHRHGIGAEHLSVEVLETVVASPNHRRIEANLAALAKLGCGIDLDDFGTGSASLTNVLRFSIERIKIDRSFVRDIDTDPKNRAIVSAIITMADRLGLDTLAEGAETEAELRTLTELGCGHVQGFAIARPMPREETSQWMPHYLARRGDASGVHRYVG